MLSKAKCKLCGDIIETCGDIRVHCDCGEISVVLGEDGKTRGAAKDWRNFIYVDDAEGEILVDRIDDQSDRGDQSPVDTKEDLIRLVEKMIDDIDKLPPHGQMSSLTQYDEGRLLLLFLRFLKL